MERAVTPRPGRRIRLVGLALLAGAAVYALRAPLAGVAGLAFRAAAVCFIAVPMARWLERWFSRPLAALACLLILALGIAALLWLLLPGLTREAAGLARALPESIERLSAWMEGAREWLQARLPGLSLPRADWSFLTEALPGLAGGTFSLAASLAELVGRASMTLVLAWFFLCDRDRLLLRLELLLPQAARHTAVRMGNAVCRELRLYLLGQLAIAGVVGALSAVALLIVGVRNALALGPLIGLLNMIPYFGPYIGGLPAVLIALGDGWKKAALTALALVVVQQLDGSWISPRIIGSLTGFSPALILVGIYAGARLGGIGGMLLSMPAMMTVRTLFRVFVQKCENI